MNKAKLPIHILSVLGFSVLAAASLAGQDDPNLAKIRDEAMNHSQIPQTLSYLSDVIGPRLTASPAMWRANNWTKDQLTSWGLVNAQVEPWGNFGRGWQLNHFAAEVVAPLDIPLIAYPKAWSPSLRDTTAEVVMVDAADMDSLMKYKGKLAGKIVLSGAGRKLAAHFTGDASRYTDDQLKEMADAQPGAPRGGGGGGQRQGGGGGGQQGRPDFRAQQQMAGAKLRFFLDEGALAVIDQGRPDDGTLVVQQASVPPDSMTPAPAAAAGAPQAPPRPRISAWSVNAPKNIPQVTLSAEQYNRLSRILAAGETVKMRLGIDGQWFDKDTNGYNTIAEIPGGDLKDQIVMVGGHMDSWHTGTGATDNGAGSAVAMEAVRILKTLNLPMRRTVRVALWSGEEEGLFGSAGYVAKHVGTFPPRAATAGAGGGGGGFGAQRDLSTVIKGPDYDKISAYYNLDNGTGKIRGIYLQGNAALKDLFQSWLNPFAADGASTVTIRNTGSTDHVSFDNVGVPGFQFIQDTIDYGSRTHHTNQDVYDRIQEDDLKQAAMIMATFIYRTANMDEMLTRKK